MTDAMAEMPRTDELVDKALELDEEELYAHLGATQVVLNRGEFAHESLTRVMDVEEFDLGMSLPDVRKLGRRLFDKISPHAYAIMCGTDEAWKDERDAINNAVKAGIGAIAKAIAAALAFSGLAAAIAAFIAALIMKLLWQGAIELTCDLWKGQLPSQPLIV